MTKTSMIAVMAVAAGSAMGQINTVTETSFSGFGATMPFGTGNQNENYVVTTNTALNFEIGIKGKERFVGQLAPTVGNVYTALPGSPTSNGLSGWNVDFAFNFFNNDRIDYGVFIDLDFDSGVGSTSFVTVDLGNPLAQGLGVGLNTDSGGGSQNLGFGFWQLDPNALPFDVNAAGEYELVIRVVDEPGNEVGRATAFVNVVPTPASAAMLGLAGMAAARRRR
ncbi:MAG: hypothetical protein AAF747_04105 [Planctomycetota bacterium]